MVALTMNGDEALAWNERALAVANDSTDPLARRWRTSLYNNIAWTHHESGDYARALDNFQKALTESRALDDAEVTHIAKWSVGRALRSLRRHAEALAIQRELASEATPADGYVFEEIAENLLALGRGTESTPYFAEAFALLSNDPELAASEPERIERLRALAGTSPEAPRE
ncbi:MAG: tetratricopeptide repeat protein [Deltaproteobacteria bacterium]|nr:tetratricopeptide repeat protein [Deltaproteobacteria bacterium]